MTQGRGDSGPLRVLLEPAPAILLAAALVHAVRRDAFDLTVFLGVVAVIVADSVRRPPDRQATPQPSSHPRWAAATAAVVGAAVGALPLGSWAVRIALAALGLVALAVVVVRAPAAAAMKPPPTRGWVLWAGTLLLIALLELANFLAQPDPQTDSYRHPTLSALIGPHVDARPVRMVVVACWLVGLVWIVRACGRSAVDAQVTTDHSR